MSAHELAQRDSWYVQQGSMFENPYGVPREEILRIIEEETPETVAQVVFGKYVESAGLVFTGELITQLFDGAREQILGNEWIDTEALIQGRIEQAARFLPWRYAVGADLARKKDYTVIFVIDTVSFPARVVYYKRLNRVPWDTIYAELGKASLYLFPGPLLIDATATGGDVILESLESRVYCPTHHLVFTAESRCPHGTCDARLWRRFNNVEGYVFSAGTKVALVNHLQNVLGHDYDQNEPDRPFGRLRCPRLAVLEEELAQYSFDDRKLMTDTVFGLALAVWLGLEDKPGLIDSAPIHGD